jgi:membrane protein required for colicin V production
MSLSLLLQSTTGSSNLAVIDMVGLGLVALLVLLGLWRGLWWQIIRLAGVVAAVTLARAFGAGIAEILSERWPDLSSRLAQGIGWVAVFVVTMGAATLLGFLGNRLISAMQLGLLNRFGGAVAGALTGLLIHIALIVGICQLAPEDFVSGVLAGSYSEDLYEAVGSRWPVVINEKSAVEVDKLFGDAREIFEKRLSDDGDSPPEVR